MYTLHCVSTVGTPKQSMTIIVRKPMLSCRVLQHIIRQASENNISNTQRSYFLLVWKAPEVLQHKEKPQPSYPERFRFEARPDCRRQPQWISYMISGRSHLDRPGFEVLSSLIPTTPFCANSLALVTWARQLITGLELSENRDYWHTYALAVMNYVIVLTEIKKTTTKLLVCQRLCQISVFPERLSNSSRMLIWETRP